MTKLRTLRLGGTPFERGAAHGEQFRAEIHDHMQKWKAAAEDELKMPVEEYLPLFLSKTDFLPAIEQYAPDILQEIKGLSQGSGMPFEWTLTRQLSDEEPWFRNTLKYGVDLAQHCTSVGLRRENLPNLIGQNMDTPKYYDGAQLLMEIDEQDSDLSYKIITVTGKISLCGMNNYGVGITCNTVIQLDYNPRGLPEDVLVRKALQSKSFAELQDFLKKIPHASGQNYVYGGPDGVQSLECSASSKVNSMLDDSDGIFFHTNHDVCNQDTQGFDMGMKMLQQKMPQIYKNLTGRLQRDTYRRYEVVEALMRGLEKHNPQGLMSVLSDRTSPLSLEHADPFSNISLNSVVMVLDREHPTLFATNGPAHLNEYEKFDFLNQ